MRQTDFRSPSTSTIPNSLAPSSSVSKDVSPTTALTFKSIEEPTKQWWYNFSNHRAIFKGDVYLAVKRLFDLLLVLLFSPILLFTMGICALLIKIESPGGPILFKQKRTGRDGVRFTMYKFRTMVPNAEALKKELVQQNELQWPDFKIKRDPRITHIGRILRKTSLDELPQILNIVKGDMSLVGPRPTSFGPETYQAWQHQRLQAPPGLTGLWQILGRGKMEFHDRALLDIAYIQRQSFVFDLIILLRTFVAVVRQRGAS